MRDKLFSKSLAFFVIFLFVGASVGICSYDKTKGTITESEGGPITAVSNCNCDKNSGGLTSEDIAVLQKQIETEGWTYTVSENPATKYSIDQLCGLVEPDDWSVGATFDNIIPTSTLPESFDWREVVDGLPPIRNQASCGSCWAFGTIAPLECSIKIKDGVWEAYTNGHIYRADDKNKDPSDAATTAIKNELLAVWLKYISQHPEFLLEVKIGSLENQVLSLLEKNKSLAKTIASKEQEINNKGKEIGDALAAARARFPNF